jgi:hypothetical protein
LSTTDTRISGAGSDFAGSEDFEESVVVVEVLDEVSLLGGELLVPSFPLLQPTTSVNVIIKQSRIEYSFLFIRIFSPFLSFHLALR